MFRNYIITAIRNITKYKVHSVINILGFAVALSVVILLFLYVFYEASADKFHQNYNNIYQPIIKYNQIISTLFVLRG